MKIIEATFTGQNGSLNYIKGRRYVLQVFCPIVDNNPIVIKPIPFAATDAKVCLYSNFETFLCNWDEIKVHRKY